MQTREDEFREVRRLLGEPKEQKPSPDLIIAAGIREEQFMLNKLNGTGRSWTEDVTTITTVVNQGDYVLAPTGTAFGKALYAYRDLGNNVIVPVPFTDHNSEIMNQSYDLYSIPVLAGVVPPVGFSKLGFFRTADGSRKVRVYPIPETAGVVYTIIYATGALDWSTFTWSDVPLLPEWSYFRCMKVAKSLLGDAEWSGCSRAENIEERKEKSILLSDKIEEENAEYQLFIRNPANEPSISTVDAWYEGPGQGGFW